MFKTAHVLVYVVFSSVLITDTRFRKRTCMVIKPSQSKVPPEPEEPVSATNSSTDEEEEDEDEEGDHVTVYDPGEAQNHLIKEFCDHSFKNNGFVINPYQFHVTFDVMKSACVRCSVCLAVVENVLDFAMFRNWRAKYIRGFRSTEPWRKFTGRTKGKNRTCWKGEGGTCSRRCARPDSKSMSSFRCLRKVWR